MAELQRTQLSVRQERALLVGVILPDSTADPRDPLGELASLAKTAGAKVVGSLLQKRQSPDPGLYIGSGKAKEVAELCKRHLANVVIFDNDLSPAQIGGLEKVINEAAGSSKKTRGIKVLDRSELILDIFATRAQTHEAKLQVELAQMQYTYPRLAKMWGHLDSLVGGGIGTRGPGETQLETDRRLVRKRIGELTAEIRQIQERKARLVAARTRQHFTACLVGYTNAGKSTLFNTLTDAGTYADDKLFATLDTKTRAWKLDKSVQVLLSDTVGFVRDLPHNLVASFKATLEEAVHADLLLHVLDVGHPRARQQYETVHQVLEEIGARGGPAGAKPELLLLNKIDTPEGAHEMHTWKALHPQAIAISARTGQGLAELVERVADFIRGQQTHAVLLLPASDGRLISHIERVGQILDRRYDNGHVELDLLVGQRALADLARHPGVEVLRSRPVDTADLAAGHRGLPVQP
ncbi:MAG: GTPase HflX [Tepidisphaerales bacterium]